MSAVLLVLPEMYLLLLIICRSLQNKKSLAHELMLMPKSKIIKRNINIISMVDQRKSTMCHHPILLSTGGFVRHLLLTRAISAVSAPAATPPIATPSIRMGAPRFLSSDFRCGLGETKVSPSGPHLDNNLLSQRMNYVCSLLQAS